MAVKRFLILIFQIFHVYLVYHIANVNNLWFSHCFYPVFYFVLVDSPSLAVRYLSLFRCSINPPGNTEVEFHWTQSSYLMHEVSLNGTVQSGTMARATRYTVHSVFDKLTWDRISFHCCVSLSNSHLDINQILYKVVQNIRNK